MEIKRTSIASLISFTALLLLSSNASAKQLRLDSDPTTVRPFISGGAPVNSGDRDYQVALRANSNTFCGGVLVHDYWVLTAAHCVLNLPSSAYHVRMGHPDITHESNVNIPVSRHVIHPSYVSLDRAGPDLALVRLNSPAPSNLPRLNIADEVVMAQIANPGNIVTTSGWAVTETGGAQPDVLQSVDLFIQHNSECSEATNIHFPDYVMCLYRSVNNSPVGACQGDSGGPVTARMGANEFLVGINSFIAGKNPADHPELVGANQCTQSITGAVKVSNYSNWIANTITPPSGTRVCEFNGPSSGTTPGCTQRAIGGGGPTIAYEVRKDGVFLLYVAKTTENSSWNRTCRISTSSSAYSISGNCEHYRVIKR